MKYWIPIICFIFICRSFGQIWNSNYDYGKASFQLLKLHLSPRTVALAGAGTALNGSSLEATDVNPAAAGSDSGIIWLGHGIPYREFQSFIPNLTWNIPIGSYRLSLNTRYLGFKDIPGWDEDRDPTSAYSSHTIKVQSGLAGIFHSVYWGLSANYALNSISFANYHTVLFNAGLQYQIIPGLWTGGAITNGEIWTSSAIYSENENPVPPTVARMGFAYHINLPKGFLLRAALDARTRIDERLNFPAGIEIGWREMLYFRTGYAFKEPEQAMPFGAGLKWGLFVLDYAFQRHKTLSPGHYFALGIRF
jgi:hypothetical protein